MAANDIATDPELGLTTVMMCLFFGVNFILFLVFTAVGFISPKEDVVEKSGGKEKKLSKPFVGSLECFSNLTTELFRTGLLMAMTYICEKHWFFEHSSKSYSRDLFIFVVLLFFGLAAYTIKPIKDLTLLGREQTEEWKGWMQFIFLLYHYFHAEEVYNSVRVMITCYVWMTGFGNFSFFYIKRDFGWLRLVQMLWRLNFSVLLLMWTHGNTYILYYICPLHTFYFLLTFATMYIFSSINHSKWGIRWKLVVVGILIYIVWDINGGLFDILFAWLGTGKVIGASSGSVWEYYFRTSLDHYSTYYGMIFALNFPLAEQYFVKAKGWPLVIASVLMFAATIWWFKECYMLEKLTYNLTHAYFAFIPLTSYIFFRNITPAIRSRVSMSLHDLGKTTLETYLLQHHIWLTSNAKTLLTIVPDYPWVNFFLASMLFLFSAKELYRLTMSLRGMILPDDKNIAWRNLLGTTTVLVVAFGVACVLRWLHIDSVVDISIVCSLSAAVLLLVMCRLTDNFADNQIFATVSRYTLIVLAVLTGALIVFNLVLIRSPSAATTHAAAAAASITPLSESPHRILVDSNSLGTGNSNLDSCLKVEMSNNQWLFSYSDDSWNSGNPTASALGANSADRQCRQVTPFSTSDMQSLFQQKHVLFVGDAQLHKVFIRFVAAIDPQSNAHILRNAQDADDVQLNSNEIMTIRDIKVEFVWAPYVANITAALAPAASVPASADLVVTGVALWDALHVHDLNAFEQDLQKLAGAVGDKLKTQTVSVWLQPGTIQNSRLQTYEKGKYMTEEIVQKYRSAFRKSRASDSFSTAMEYVCIPSTTSPAAGGEVDEVGHAAAESFDVAVQLAMHSYALHSVNSRALQLNPTLHTQLAVDTTTNTVLPLLPTELTAAATDASSAVGATAAATAAVTTKATTEAATEAATAAAAAAAAEASGGAKTKEAKYEPRRTGAMSFPSYGAMVLAMACVMLFLMDSFFGFGYISLIVFGIHLDWEAAYLPLLTKLFGTLPTTVTSPETGTRGTTAVSHDATNVKKRVGAFDGIERTGSAGAGAGNDDDNTERDTKDTAPLLGEKH